MRLSIPIVIEERGAGPGRAPLFVVRPLFHAEPVSKSDKLGRALNRLTGLLKDLLDELGREPRHDALADWAFCPVLEDTTLDLRLELGSGSHHKSFFFAGYASLRRKLFFTSSIPGLHFEVLPGQDLAARATEVLTKQFREMEREGASIPIEDVALQGRARLSILELDVRLVGIGRKPPRSRRAFLTGEEEKMDGEQELRRTGRPLHALYPDDLDRAVDRTLEVEELARLLAGSDRRPILLVGPRQAGKTAILHELAFQMRARKSEHFGGGREIWLLAPQRLISGMSYVGQWENRITAILDFARRKDHVLYFDDLPGLLAAGKSSASDLNVANLLQPVLEKRGVRVLAEITPESWRVLRERARAFADLFHVVPVREPTEVETLRILVHVARELETRHRCRFALEVVPLVYDLQRRFGGDAAFPGKAAAFLRRLAVRGSQGAIGKHDVRAVFGEQTGLHPGLLDDGEDFSRPAIRGALQEHLAGQPQVVEAFADILVKLRARLNDPRRPLGVFLLLGPTGVGKTQSAKALARHLFGDSERLLRFDMNEFIDAAAAARLAGTPDEPEGLLTGAIRRQPFSVVLLDEIEKAAPEVFDVLLALLDEGLLTDALGRVANFSNAVILLTSNLGARESWARLGFGAAEGCPEDEDAVYVAAAEKFFRPEFFNRLDRVIPFRPLATEDLEVIARRAIAEVFSRDGLRRRDCILRVSPRTMNRLVETGRDPKLGARALKRVIEREVAQPVAARLAALPPTTAMLVDFGADQQGFTVATHPLRAARRSRFWYENVSRLPVSSERDLIAAAGGALDRIEAELELQAPSGRLELGKLPPEAERYFACREQFGKVERLLQAVEQGRQPAKVSSPVRIPRPKPTKLVVRQIYSGDPIRARQQDAAALQVELAEWDASDPVEVADSPVTALCRELALLHALVLSPRDDRPLALIVRPIDPGDWPLIAGLRRAYQQFFDQVWGCSTTEVGAAVKDLATCGVPESDRLLGLYLTGYNLRHVLGGENGNVLFRRKDGSIGLLSLCCGDAGSPAEAAAWAKKAFESARLLSVGESLGPMQWRIDLKAITDFRSGLVVPFWPSPEQFRALVLSALPLPSELDAWNAVPAAAEEEPGPRATPN